MATLQEMLLRPDVEPQVVSDTLALVDSELKSKSGLSGTAVKVAFKAITSLARSSMILISQSSVTLSAHSFRPILLSAPTSRFNDPSKIVTTLVTTFNRRGPSGRAGDRMKW